MHVLQVILLLRIDLIWQPLWQVGNLWTKVVFARLVQEWTLQKVQLAILQQQSYEQAGRLFRHWMRETSAASVLCFLAQMVCIAMRLMFSLTRPSPSRNCPAGSHGSRLFGRSRIPPFNSRSSLDSSSPTPWNNLIECSMALYVSSRYGKTECIGSAWKQGSVPAGL